jgi:branched-chain amino acid transport system ATP-binding protein
MRLSEAMLECTGIDAFYGPVQILFGVDFSVQPNEVVALLGTNGAGKSTLLRAISGLTPPSNGAVFYDGEDITYLPAHEHAGRGIVQVPGGKGTFPGLTVGENLRLAAWMYRSDDEYVKQATEEVFGYFPILRERINEQAGNLSGGEQQVLEMAMVLVTEPTLLLLDEPSLGLSPKLQTEVFETVRAIAAGGVTVLMVEQNVRGALAVSDTAIVLDLGRKFLEGPARDVMVDPRIRQAYLGGTIGQDSASQESAA